MIGCVTSQLRNTFTCRTTLLSSYATRVGLAHSRTTGRASSGNEQGHHTSTSCQSWHQNRSTSKYNQEVRCVLCGPNTSVADIIQGKRIPKLPSETSIYLQGSGSDLYQRIASQSGFSLHRLRITKADDGKPIPNDKSVSIDSTGLKDGSGIQVKDLGASRR